MSPTARALAQLRKDGWLPAVVEKFNPGARVRQDLFGFIDIVAIHPSLQGVLGIQVTTNAHMSDRFTKMLAEPVRNRVWAWLWASNAVEIWGYAKTGPRGKRKTWTLTRRPVTLGDLEA
jgi:hypothetical protein